MATPKSKSTKPPAFQFYPADFLNDDAVEDMTFTEIGVYVVMLCKDWLGKGLPADIGKIASRISGGKHHITRARLERLLEGPVSSRFNARDGRLFNPRLEDERKKQKAFLRRQSDNGSLGGRPKKNPTQSGGFSVSKPRARDETETNALGSSLKEKVVAEFDGQAAFMRLYAEYPSHRRDDSQIVQSEFCQQLQKHGPTMADAFAEMLDNLRNNRASEEWQRGVIPNLETWLTKGKWKNRYESGVKVTTTKTSGNVDVLRRFAERGRPA